jgi:hypothetical protein
MVGRTLIHIAEMEAICVITNTVCKLSGAALHVSFAHSIRVP